MIDKVLREILIGQDQAIDAIVPYVHIFQSHLSPAGRPAGVFLLLGPTGTGKTHTVECLAEALHGNRRHHLRIDCGEYQMDHEVAKLIGAPPGYLGHRETAPAFNQAKLNSFCSERCGMSIVLLDEIEKAAPSFNRLLLGILDKAKLRLGDNTSVDFERSMIFMTSNLGAREIMSTIVGGVGFSCIGEPSMIDNSILSRIEQSGVRALKRQFSPEFYNRIDRVVTYAPLNGEAFSRILDIHIGELQHLMTERLGTRAPNLHVANSARQQLLKMGTSREYGARELRRTIHRNLLQPIASRLYTMGAESVRAVHVWANRRGGLEIRYARGAA